ncbi:MAG TPA: PEP-CTERM sorting domain-containing protein [Bryobacteraceae bacterium]|nr:PEP-CTERM sorting domain-containing protein [Bryobacteraceae bacterium]
MKIATNITFMSIVGLAFLNISPSNAAILYSDLGTGGSVYATQPGSIIQGSGRGGNNISQARPFTVAGTGLFDVTQFDLGVVLDLGNGTFDAAIWTSVAGAPGAPLPSASWTVTTTEPSGSCCTLVTQSGITGVTLAGGTTYFMVLTPQSLTDSNKEEWAPNTQGATSTVYGSINGGASWVFDGTNSAAAFDVIGTASSAAPEPAGFLLLSAGLAGLFAVRRRLARQG